MFGRSFKGDVYCKDGVIQQVGENLVGLEGTGTRVIDATGKYVLPGGIDTHTHCELPFMGTVAVDDFNYGTRAAVAGGTTMLSESFTFCQSFTAFTAFTPLTYLLPFFFFSF